MWKGYKNADRTSFVRYGRFALLRIFGNYHLVEPLSVNGSCEHERSAETQFNAHCEPDTDQSHS